MCACLLLSVSQAKADSTHAVGLQLCAMDSLVCNCDMQAAACSSSSGYTVLFRQIVMTMSMNFVSAYPECFIRAYPYVFYPCLHVCVLPVLSSRVKTSTA